MWRRAAQTAASIFLRHSNSIPKRFDLATVRRSYTVQQLLRKRQLKIETEGWEESAKECRELLDVINKQKMSPCLPYLKTLMLSWFEPLRDAIIADQAKVKGSKLYSHAPYFEHLSADMMAVITMHTLMRLLMVDCKLGGAKVFDVASHIGEQVEYQVRVNEFWEKGGLRRKGRGEFTPWGLEAWLKVGCRLVQLLLENAYVLPEVDQSGNGELDIRPAFVHVIRLGEGKRRCGVIECDPLVRKGLERTARHMVVMPYLPMVVPPVKWTGHDKGAYLFLPSFVMKTCGSKQQRDALRKAPKKQLGQVFEALDTLGNTRWRVNKKVLGVVERIWASGGRLGGLVDREDSPFPEEPTTNDEAERIEWKKRVRRVRQENYKRHQARCLVELKLSVAQKMKDEDGFYYPHSLDFRGRAYPMHPHLNHLGSDLCRGILEFSVGKPLQSSGLRWLKIQLSNLYAHGIDKLSFDERVAFTEKHLEDIFDSADRPLEGKRWWLLAEDPLQCLATCINLSEALRSVSPESTLSYLPIHQDGSCNGLQHYAALGRDKLGAVAVNLIEGEKPADVYSRIADRVCDVVQGDTQKDPTVHPEALHARFLIDLVDRKLVKQTVMTSVYGVTFKGACDQIRKLLKEQCASRDESELFAVAWYAAKITFDVQGKMFESARRIMTWLSDCAKIIASKNQPVRWVTPLGLPVVQPYRKMESYAIQTPLQHISLHRETDKVMAGQQRKAFPPNFVHSLDGCHMMMTAIACKNAGLSFAGVHDSFWTHPSDVDQMNKLLREKFVELYEAPVLENLLLSFQESFPTLEFPPLPERGDLDIREVLNSPYFFH